MRDSLLPLLVLLLAISSLGLISYTYGDEQPLIDAAYERECLVHNGNPHSLILRSVNGKFSARFRMASTGVSSDIGGLSARISSDKKTETYSGRNSEGQFGPRSKLEVTIESGRRGADGKSPADLHFKRFLFGKHHSAECADWMPAALSD